ncbi:DUF1648 domain-containing protein [Protaetiibacter larvae]|uniref:DUF1648 domain-containing protein n=1 Tax=Protaetiibacter larvae TaxID=2592654 RepID=A0A5C1YA03_9MICO|nr:DUF1648 domain-containing protein [Protaetiibacter larvae]QEO09722.1 DUF1648 domain-containing protein [Protaetiibacter larvae]
MTTPVRPARSRMPLSIWIVAVVLPLIAAATAVAVQLAWLPELPDPVATHWGTEGPNGFAPPWASPVLTGGVVLGLAGMFALSLGTARGAAPTATHKLLAVLSLSVAVFLGVTVTASLGVQRGLDDARDAPGLGGWLLVAAVIALALGAVAWFLLPKAVSPTEDATPAAPMPLVPGERTVWIATTRVQGGAIVAILSAVGFALAASLFAIVVSDGLVWPLALIPLLLLVMCAIGTVWRVRVDSTGITVGSRPFGVPRTRIAVSDISRVETRHVEPLADFGGWGWRWAPGRSFGVVTRRGEAIEVQRRDGRRFTVTVDDAATGAALLAAYTATAAGSGERHR